MTKERCGLVSYNVSDFNLDMVDTFMKKAFLIFLTSIGFSTVALDLNEQTEHKYADNDGVRIHYVIHGPEDAPLVVMLHGFPDFWYTWRSQIQALMGTYRVAALDLRGYNGSDKPKGVENYAMPLLVSDVLAVIKAENRDKAVIVGHDWGGAIAWNIAMTHPDLVSHLIILNLPHPNGLIRELRNNPQQQQNSQYAVFFQQEGSHNSLTAEALTNWVDDPDAKKRYVEAFQNSDFEAMTNYYKANYPRVGEESSPFAGDAVNVKCSVLMFHGLEDRALLPGALSGTWEWVDSDLTLVTIPGAEHFVQQDAPEIVNETMVDWLQRRM